MPTKAQIKRSRLLADALAGEATSTAPVGHWTQGLARVLQGGVAAYQNSKADKMEGERNQQLAQALGGNMSPDEMRNYGAVNDFPELLPMADRQEDFAYKKGRDTVEDNRWGQEFGFKKNRAAVDDSQWQQGFNADQGWKEKNYGLQKDQFGLENEKWDFTKSQPIEVGGNLVDRNTYKPLYESPASPSTVINNSMKGDNEYDKSRGKFFGDTANTFDTEERGAISALNTLGALKQQMADPNFNSGFMAGNIQALQKAAVALGVADPSLVTSKEAFNSLTNKAVLDSMGGSLGSGFSNADRDFVVGQVPNLQNSPNGNIAIVGIQEKIAQRKIEIARMARSYEQKNGRLDNGFMNELSTWAQENPLFSKVENKNTPDQSGDPQLDELLKKY